MIGSEGSALDARDLMKNINNGDLMWEDVAILKLSTHFNNVVLFMLHHQNISDEIACKL